MSGPPDVRVVEVDRASYRDSITLMRLSRDVLALDGVRQAAVVMGTDLNLSLLRDQGFTVDPSSAGPDDLVIAVWAADGDAARRAVRTARDALGPVGPPGPGETTDRPPPSVRAAARRHPDRNLVVVAVPGRNAAYEVAEALAAGMNVFCFSSGVGLEAEVALKSLAVDRGLLLMGPDCGTAVVDGVGLGFANLVGRGPIGLVGASGTGVQEVMCLLDAAGVGTSQALGVGGRDLHPDVRGSMTLAAIRLLADDPGTEVLVVVSKPPDPAVAREVAAAAGRCGKPAILAFLGAGGAPAAPGGPTIVGTLEEAARAAAALIGSTEPGPADAAAGEGAGQGSGRGWIRGLFAGGTLCAEAQVVASAVLGDVRSNAPLRPELRLGDIRRLEGHAFVDFGDERLTEGRPHPMIDPTMRDDRVVTEAADPSVGVVLVDVVLGRGAHPDPAGELVPRIRAALELRGDIHVVVAMCGAAGDPQGIDDQISRLAGAGALVVRGTAAATRRSLRVGGWTP